MIAMRGIAGILPAGGLDPDGVHAGVDQIAEAATAGPGLAIFALSVHLCAGDLAPPFGGYLTEKTTAGRPFFFVLMWCQPSSWWTALYFTLERQADAAQAFERRRLGPVIATMAVGLSRRSRPCLEEGNKDDWFASPLYPALGCSSRWVSLSLFVWIELTVEGPLIRLRLLKRRNFGFRYHLP